jgi:NitT/TauT family transport system substrate-binding protein
LVIVYVEEKMMKPTILRYVMGLLTALILISCAKPAPEMSLKMGLLPILDVLPFYVARDQGYFTAEGLQVDLTPVKSAQEQSALFQAGEIDGGVTDLQVVLVFNRETPQLKVVTIARRPYPDSPHFRIIAAPGFKVSSPKDLAQVPVGVGQNTITEYLTQRFLTTSGLPANQVAVQEVSAIPVRLEMLLNNQLKAALLPEPFGAAAIAGGGTLVVDDTQIPQFSQSVLAFTASTRQNKPNAIRAFLRAWYKAVADINRNPNAYRNVLVDNTRVPPSIQGSYNVPRFPENELTTEAEWADVVHWAQEKKLIEQPILYETSVDKSFGQ